MSISPGSCIKKTIVIHAGAWIDVCKEIISFILEHNLLLFEKEDSIVRISDQGVKYVDIWYLSSFLADHFMFTMNNTSVECPERILKMLLCRKKWGLNQLVGISRAPYLFQDKLITEYGYNPDSKIFMANCIEMSPMPAILDKKAAKRAMTVFKAPFLSFPYKYAHGLSVAISAALTGLIRRNMNSAPLHAFTAPKMATGKSLLCSIISLIVAGRRTAVISQSTNPDADNKRFLSLLLEGEAVVCMDNIEKPMFSSTLCSILTEPWFKDRILGKSQLSPECSTSALFMINGNNLVIQGDLSSRTICCSLDAKMEEPEKRHFPGDIREEVLRDRSKLLHAAFVILLAYMKNSNKVRVTTFGRFEQWSSMVREAIIWCGLPDPCNSLEEINASDPVRRKLKNLLMSWHTLTLGKPARVLDVLALAKKIEKGDIESDIDTKEAAIIFNETALGIAFCKKNPTELSARSIGKFFSKHEGRIEMSYLIERAGSINRSERWQTRKQEAPLQLSKDCLESGKHR